MIFILAHASGAVLAARCEDEKESIYLFEKILNDRLYSILGNGGFDNEVIES